MRDFVIAFAVGTCVGASVFCFWARFQAQQLIRKIERMDSGIREYVEDHHRRNKEFLTEYTKICDENRRVFLRTLGLETTNSDSKKPS